MDIAVNLVQSFLRLNGYMTISEVEIEGKDPEGDYVSLTDVDIVGIRFPGDVYAADAHRPEDCRLLLIHDDALMLEEDQVDVIIGEVKQGEAVLNEALTRHEVLHSVLRRLEWVYAGRIDDVITELRDRRLSVVDGRGGTPIRTRIVAFGQADSGDLHTIQISHVIESMLEFMEDFDAVLRPAQFREPAPALLRLLIKAGIHLDRDR